MSIETFTPAELEAFERVMRNALRNDFYAFVEKAFQAVSPGEPFLPNWHLASKATLSLCSNLFVSGRSRIDRQDLLRRQ